MDIILIHAAWWAFGFLCGVAGMGALAFSGTINRDEDEAESEPKPALKP